MNSLSVCLSVYPRFTFEWLKLDPQTHIYLESVSPRERLKHVYIAIPLSVIKKAKICTFARRKNGLKLGMQTLDSANNMGWVPSGHTSSSLCVRLKMPNVVLIKTL